MAALEDWKREIADEDDDEVVDEYTPVTESVIYLIESTNTMISPDAPESTVPDTTQRTKLNWIGRPAKSKLELTLRCALALMRRKIISAPKDKVAIVLYNTEVAQSKDEYSNIYIVQDLAQPTAESMKALKELLEDVENDPSILEKRFKPQGKYSNLADALSCAASMFRTKAAMASMVKTLVLVTDNDDPVHVDQLRPVGTRRMDLYASGYDLHPVLINSRPDKEFDLLRFWDDFIRKVDEEDADVEMPQLQVSWNLDAALMAMQDALHSREAMKRSAFRVPFQITKELVIGVQGYALVGEERKRLPIKYNPNSAEGYEVVKQVVTKDSALDDAEELDPGLIKKFVSLGQAEVGSPPIRIFLSDDEMRKLKAVGMSPCLKLLGFKPRKDNLKFQESVKHSYFLQPDEDSYSGSRRTFVALIESMVKRDVIGYAVLLARKSARPQICVLLAQKEQLNNSGHQERAAGLHVIQLPFADDIREIGITSTVSAIIPPNPEQERAGEIPDQPGIDAAKKIGKHLLKDYNPEAFPNPALNYHYETLAALALNEPIPDPIDKSVPAFTTIDARAGQYIRELRHIFPEDEYDPSLVETSKKKRPMAASERAAVLGDVDAIKAFAQDLEERGLQLKVNELKDGLKLLNEKLSGTKQVLYDRVVAALQDKGFWESGAADSDDQIEVDKKKDGRNTRKTVTTGDDDEDGL